jgi:hypothetical protein
VKDQDKTHRISFLEQFIDHIGYELVLIGELVKQRFGRFSRVSDQLFFVSSIGVSVIHAWKSDRRFTLKVVFVGSPRDRVHPNQSFRPGIRSTLDPIGGKKARRSPRASLACANTVSILVLPVRARVQRWSAIRRAGPPILWRDSLACIAIAIDRLRPPGVLV